MPTNMLLRLLVTGISSFKDGWNWVSSSIVLLSPSTRRAFSSPPPSFIGQRPSRFSPRLCSSWWTLPEQAERAPQPRLDSRPRVPFWFHVPGVFTSLSSGTVLTCCSQCLRSDRDLECGIDEGRSYPFSERPSSLLNQPWSETIEIGSRWTLLKVEEVAASGGMWLRVGLEEDWIFGR